VQPATVIPETISAFDDAISLVSTRGGVLRGALDREWWSGMGPHGGYLAAIMTRAALANAHPSQQLRSLTIHYLQPGREGTVEVHRDAVRVARTATTVQLTMRQDGEPVLAGIATLLKDRSSPEVEDVEMPEVTLYEETKVSRFLVDEGVSDIAPAFAHHLEYRQCLGPAPLSGGPEALTGGWLRMRDDRPIDAAAAAMLMDAWWPAMWSRLRQVPRSPTVDLTIHFRRPMPETSEPVLALFRTRLWVNGFVDEEGELWSADGKLLVQSRQLAVLLTASDAF
jgi:acyl-coenzyme A thioesterase PaaI-like protein